MLLARDWFHGKQRFSPFYHGLGLDLVGLIGNFWIFEQLLPLVVEQLPNPIPSKGTSVLITLGTNEELDCPPTTGFSVLS